MSLVPLSSDEVKTLGLDQAPQTAAPSLVPVDPLDDFETYKAIRKSEIAQEPGFGDQVASGIKALNPLTAVPAIAGKVADEAVKIGGAAKEVVGLGAGVVSGVAQDIADHGQKQSEQIKKLQTPDQMKGAAALQKAGAFGAQTLMDKYAGFAGIGEHIVETFKQAGLKLDNMVGILSDKETEDRYLQNEFQFKQKQRDLAGMSDSALGMAKTVLPILGKNFDATPVNREAAQTFSNYVDVPEGFIINKVGGSAVKRGLKALGADVAEEGIKSPAMGMIAAAQSRASDAAAMKAAQSDLVQSIEQQIAESPAPKAIDKPNWKTGFFDTTKRDAAREALVKSKAQLALAVDEDIEATTALKSLVDEAGQQSAKAGAPGVTQSLAGAATEKIGSAIQAVGDAGQRLIQGTEDSLLKAADGSSEVANALGGAVRQIPGASVVEGTSYLVSKIGGSVRAVGQVMREAETSLPFFQRLEQAMPSDMGKWTASQADRWVNFVPSIAKAAASAADGSVHGAAIGAAFGALGGDPEDGAIQGMITGAFGGALGMVGRNSDPAVIAARQAGDVNRAQRLRRDNPEQLGRFNKLTPEGRLLVATYESAYPDLNVKFTEKGSSSFDVVGGIGQATINIKSETPFAPLFAHEVAHHIGRHADVQQAINSALLGDVNLDSPGFFTARDPSGEPVLNAEGKYEPNEEFKALQAEYVQKLRAAGEEAQAQIYEKTPELIAHEIYAESAVRNILGRGESGEFNVIASLRKGPMRRLIDRFADSELVTNTGFLQSLFHKSGGLTNVDEIPLTTGLFSKNHPLEFKKLVSKYNESRQRERGPLTEDFSKPQIQYSEAEISKNPALMDLFKSGFDVTKDPVSGQLRFTTEAQARAAQKVFFSTLTKELDSYAGPEKNVVKKVVEVDAKGRTREVWQGQLIPQTVVDRMRVAGKFNGEQLKMLQTISDSLKQGSGNEVHFMYQPASSRGSKVYRTRAVTERIETPVSIKITQDGNVLVNTLSQEKLVRNALDAVKKGDAGLWGNDLKSLWTDVQTYISNHANGRPGAEGIGVPKRDFINSLFGQLRNEQRDANPILQDESVNKARNRGIVTSRRLDRINKMTVLDTTFQPSYISVAKNLRPEALPESEAPLSAQTEKAPQAETPAEPKRIPETTDSEMRISTRTPSAKASTENPLTSQLAIGTEHVLRDYETKTKIAAILKKYPNVPKELTKPGDVIDNFKKQVTDNLLWLHDSVDPEIRDRSKLWYDGGRKLVEDFSAEHQIERPAAAGVLASLSPQKDWFMNVDLARRVIETHKILKDGPLPDEVVKWFKGKFGEKDPEALTYLEGAVGEKLSSLDTWSKAVAIRAHDEIHNARSYKIVNPEGDFAGKATNANGADSKVAWGDFNSIAKAVSILEDSSRQNISKQLGDEHKVRNFYNNLLLPNNPEHGDVTIDTHAVAAGTLRPLAGSDEPVTHNFGGGGAPGSSITGASGLYGLYADAYRDAAKQRGILPREMQSITWEAVRGLFPAEFKNAGNKAKIDAIWKEYQDGKKSLDETRDAISAAAGGIRPPTWFVPNP